MLLLLIIPAWALAIAIVAGLCVAASNGDAQLDPQGAIEPGRPRVPGAPGERGEPGRPAPRAASEGEARELAA
ncbi:MAG TPA: hypothetical protein VF927_07785 [Solirubrobacteraceae bacterium]